MWSELSEAYGLWSGWSQDEKTSSINKALKVRGQLKPNCSLRNPTLVHVDHGNEATTLVMGRLECHPGV